MWEELFRWINENYPTVGAFLAFGIVIWIIATLYSKWGHRVKAVEDECLRINANIDKNIIPRLDAIESSLSTITATLNRLITSFNSLIAHLAAKDDTIQVTLFITRSPIELGPDGLRLLEESGGKTWVDNNLSLLLKELEDHGGPTALDIQTNAPKIILAYSLFEEFKTIKNYIYNNPYYKQTPDSKPNPSIPLTLDYMATIMGVYLRNIYLEKHPALKPPETIQP